jgi:2-polyprenyl-3-methyl-5-hydroxy-6-metoxy-1,4-benzoquinol methylase
MEMRSSVALNTMATQDYDYKSTYYDVNEAYSFPYHHLAYFDENGTGHTMRTLYWGLEYLCYIRHVQEIAMGLKPDSVLDIGCGDGVFVGTLPGNVRRRMGVDLSQRAIGFAKAFFPDVEFNVQNAADLSEQFAVTVAIEVLEHIPDEGVGFFLNTMSDRTKPEGHAIICVPSTFYPPAELSSSHYCHYNEQVFRERLAAANTSLEIINVEYVYRYSRPFNYFHRILNNTRWTIDIKPVRKWMWNHVWKNLRIAGPNDGLHLVVTMRNPRKQA